MGTIVIVVYKPHAGKAKDLEELVARHVPVLRMEKLATERQPVMMRAADGSIVEVFEWVSTKAIEAAHNNPRVQELWAQFEKICTYERADSLPEFRELFSSFESIN
ncbi:MAG TPA: hypothetical protein VKZ68_00460 [Ohtaekwangia sp.]|nr:hypothetical protein [Ohtaekwangia sp.]